MKRIMLLLFFMLFAGVNSYAASGDLVVNGNVSVGTAIIFPDGSKQTTATAVFSGAGVPNGMAKYLTPGSYNFIVPAGIGRVLIEAWGAGGAGGAVYGFFGGCGGGSGGQYRGSLPVTPGQTYAVIVGAGGIGTLYSNGSNGGDSSFGGTLAVAHGGGGGSA
jgi:hypothetical protein